MPYFEHTQEETHDRQFADDAETLLEETQYEHYDDDFDPDEMYDPEPESIREDRLRVLSGVADLLSTALAALCVLGLLALLISLFSWVYNDLTQSFGVLDRI